MAPRVATALARRISAARAAEFVTSGMWLDYGAVLGQPDVFDNALAERTAELRNVKIRSCLSIRPRAVLEADPEGEHFSGSTCTSPATTGRSTTPAAHTICR